MARAFDVFSIAPTTLAEDATMNPVRGETMIGFLHWIAREHPEITALRGMEPEVLMGLINRYEAGRLDNNTNLTHKWREGLRYLFQSSGDWSSYDQARDELDRLERRRR